MTKAEQYVKALEEFKACYDASKTEYYLDMLNNIYIACNEEEKQELKQAHNLFWNKTSNV